MDGHETGMCWLGACAAAPTLFEVALCLAGWTLMFCQNLTKFVDTTFVHLAAGTAERTLAGLVCSSWAVFDSTMNAQAQV